MYIQSMDPPSQHGNSVRVSLCDRITFISLNIKHTYLPYGIVDLFHRYHASYIVLLIVNKSIVNVKMRRMALIVSR